MSYFCFHCHKPTDFEPEYTGNGGTAIHTYVCRNCGAQNIDPQTFSLIDWINNKPLTAPEKGEGK